MQPSYKIFQSFTILFFTFFISTANAQDSLIIPAMQKKNSIGIKYDHIAFAKNNNKAWHLLSLEYTRQTKKMPLIARINYASRFAKSGLQFEVDAYPSISKKIYAYVSAGYSKEGLLFPKYRAGASLYISLPAAIEIDGGFRVLYFNTSTWIFTTAIGKYYKNYWFHVSAFLTPDSNAVSQSYYAKCRYYINDQDYIMLLIGTGTSPDDRTNNIQLNPVNRLSSRKAELSVRKTYLTNVVFFNIGLMKQEYELKKYSNQFNAGIGFQKMF